MMQKQKKANAIKNNLWIIITGVIVIAVIVLAYVLISNQSKVLSPGINDDPNANSKAESFPDGPNNMPQDGITIGSNFEAEPSTEKVASGIEFTAEPFTARDDNKTTVRIYLDPQCPVCGVFEKTNGELIKKYVEEDKIVVQYHPISFLDQASKNEYSSRATNALACVADTNPNNFFDFLNILFVNQPAEGTNGLSNGEIYALAQKTGIEKSETLETCIYSKQFEPWVTDATNRALNGGPLPGTNNGSVQGTPAIFINGKQIEVAPNDGNAFQAALDQAINK